MNLDPRHRPICGADELSEYAAGRLTAARIAVWDAHLQECARCRYALAEEQWVRARLSSGGPSMPGGLHSSLLALARSGPAVPEPAPAQRVTPPPAVAPVRVLSPTAPPVHRSALRSTALAAAAVGASVAAAWSLGVVASTSAAGAPIGVRGGPVTFATVPTAVSTTSAAVVRSSVLSRPVTLMQDPNAPCVADPAQSSP